MTAQEPSVREEELHAYVDGQLPGTRLSAVLRYLEAHPSEATRIAQYSAQREALRAAFRTSKAEPLPPSLEVSRLLEAQVQRRLRSRFAVAAALALAVGGAGGWFLHSSPPVPRLARAMSALEEQALAAHAVYATERRHPVEMTGDQHDAMTQWLSARLDRKVLPPDLSAAGYRLIGGRLLATERGSASALFLYETSDGKRLSLLMRPMAPDLKSPEVELSRSEWNSCAWIAHGMGYALVGAAPDTPLDKLADQIRAETRRS